MKTPSRQREEAFYKRWNIPFDAEAEFEKFRNRVLRALDISLGQYLCAPYSKTNEILIALGYPDEAKASYAGIDELFGDDPDLTENDKLVRLLSDGTQHYFKDHLVYLLFSSMKSEMEIISGLQHVAWILEEIFPLTTKQQEASDGLTVQLAVQSKNWFEDFVREISTAINASPFVGVRVVQKGKGVLFVPSGVRILDDGLVNDILWWLSDYPKVCKAFEQALIIYQTKDEAKYRNLVDNLRFAVEQLLKQVLNNSKPIEKQQAELGRWLQTKGVNQEVINLYQALLNGPYTKLQNEAVKHNEKPFSTAEIEFLIYLTGTFIRLVLQSENGK